MFKLTLVILELVASCIQTSQGDKRRLIWFGHKDT